MIASLTTITAIIGWLCVKVSEKDTRFNGIDDTEGVVFISGNFSEEYEIDAERKFQWPKSNGVLIFYCRLHLENKNS